MHLLLTLAVLAALIGGQDTQASVKHQKQDHRHRPYTTNRSEQTLKSTTQKETTEIIVGNLQKDLLNSLLASELQRMTTSEKETFKKSTLYEAQTRVPDFSGINSLLPELVAACRHALDWRDATHTYLSESQTADPDFISTIKAFYGKKGHALLMSPSRREVCLHCMHTTRETITPKNAQAIDSYVQRIIRGQGAFSYFRPRDQKQATSRGSIAIALPAKTEPALEYQTLIQQYAEALKQVLETGHLDTSAPSNIRDSTNQKLLIYNAAAVTHGLYQALEEVITQNIQRQDSSPTITPLPASHWLEKINETLGTTLSHPQHLDKLYTCAVHTACTQLKKNVHVQLHKQLATINNVAIIAKVTKELDPWLSKEEKNLLNQPGVLAELQPDTALTHNEHLELFRRALQWRQETKTYIQTYDYKSSTNPTLITTAQAFLRPSPAWQNASYMYTRIADVTTTSPEACLFRSSLLEETNLTIKTQTFHDRTYAQVYNLILKQFKPSAALTPDTLNKDYCAALALVATHQHSALFLKDQKNRSLLNSILSYMVPMEKNRMTAEHSQALLAQTFYTLLTTSAAHKQSVTENIARLWPANDNASASELAAHRKAITNQLLLVWRYQHQYASNQTSH
jgi:hypothetical protein